MISLDTQHVIHAQLEVVGCTAELYLNDVPLSRLGPGTATLESVSAQHHLVAGKNRLELLVEPGPSPSLARSDPRPRALRGARAVGRLSRFPFGVAPVESLGQTLTSVTWRSDELTPPPAEYPRSLFAEVDLGPIVGRWAYEDAPVLSMDPALVGEARAVLDDVAGALGRGSVEDMSALLEAQWRDVHRAYPALPAGFLAEELGKTVAHYRRSKRATLPLAADRHDFRLVAAGRMVECIDDDWIPSLRLCSPEGAVVPYALFLARLGGRLRIVR